MRGVYCGFDKTFKWKPYRVFLFKILTDVEVLMGHLYCNVQLLVKNDIILIGRKQQKKVYLFSPRIMKRGL